MDGRTTFVIMLVIIMSWLVMVHNAPVDRKVLTCYWPDCREVRVNVTEIREVFVTSCRLNRVVVFGDPTVIKIRDLHGHICEATFSPTAPKHTTIGQTETSTTIFSSTIVPATDTHSDRHSCVPNLYYSIQ
uniref:Uncharacterized protein n=1 Tax=Magallana gigas TaxID=29159 RepID=A0A8W8MGN4_MAGGI